MGNVLSEEEEIEVLEEAYALSLDSPDVDKKVNQGTTAANCQPKHTRDQDDDYGDPMDTSTSNPHKHPRSNSNVSDEGAHRGKRQHQQALTEAEKQQKLSYFQMARLGYQELVNAIIRPPRAEYKVSHDILLYKRLIVLLLKPCFSHTLFYKHTCRRKRWDLLPFRFVENALLERTLRS